MSTRPQVIACISGAYSTRHSIATLQGCGIKEANIFFTPTEFYIQNGAEDRSVVATLVIKGECLQKYDYSAYNASGELEPFIWRGFLVKDMSDILKSIRKKDGIIITIHPDDDNIYIQPLKAVKGETPQGFDPIKGIPVEVNAWELPTFNMVPNARVDASTLTCNCTAMLNAKSIYTEFIAVDGGVLMQGIKADGTLGSSRNLGECAPKAQAHPVLTLTQSSSSSLPSVPKSDLLSKFNPEMLKTQAANAGKCHIKLAMEDAEKTRTVHIPQKIVRALGKINNVGSADSMVKVYISDPSTTGCSPTMQIITPVGPSAYGTLSLCINDHQVDESCRVKTLGRTPAK